MSDWSIIFVRFVIYTDLMLLFGLSLFGLYAGRHLLMNKLVIAFAFTGIVMSVFAFLQLAASMSGRHIFSLDLDMLRMILIDMPIGKIFLIRMASLLVAISAPLFFSERRTMMLMLATGATAVALSTLPFFGHAAASDGPVADLHLAAAMLHLLAAGAWLGALAGLFWLIVEANKSREHAQLERLLASLNNFSTIGSVIVLLIILTGAISTLMMFDLATLSSLYQSTYGRLLLIKLALFLCMLLLAAINRFILTPALDESISNSCQVSTLTNLRRSIILEIAAAIAILACVAWLGTLPTGN